MAENSGRDTIPILLGGKPYIILAYARMKKGPISKKQYKEFQLNKRKFTTNINIDFAFLVSKGLLELQLHEGVEMYSITRSGLLSLREVARRRILKERLLLRAGKLKFEDAKFKHGDD